MKVSTSIFGTVSAGGANPTFFRLELVGNGIAAGVGAVAGIQGSANGEDVVAFAVF